jgi:hypothetical protein
VNPLRELLEEIVSDKVSLGRYNRVGRLGAGLFVSLLCLWAAPAQASSINATAVCAEGDPVTGVVVNDIHASSTAGVGTSASSTNCVNQALADYGVLKVYSNSTNSNTTSQNSASFGIDFFLTDPSLAANTQVTLLIPIEYDFSLAAGTRGYAEFSLTQDSITRYVQYSSYDNPFGGNNCPNPAPTIPSCNGTYRGEFFLSMTALVNSTSANTFSLIADSRAAAGISDAYHTILIGSTIIPSNLAFSYSDVNGNPMNFQYAGVTPPPAVPEPATLSLSVIGLGMMLSRKIRAARIARA